MTYIPSGGGETNTASNQGTDGQGVYDTKSGVDLQFRHVAPASSKVTVALNGKDIDIDVDETNINHDNLNNFLPKEHINSIPGVFRDTGTTNITASAATVGLDTADINTDTSYTLSAGEITVTVGGTYCIIFSLPIELSAITPDRDNVQAYVELDDGGGGGFVAISQSYSEGYIREGAGGGGLSGGFVAAIDANDDIRLRIISPSFVSLDAGYYRTRSGQAQLSIFRIA